jgi:hypothetical protein
MKVWPLCNKRGQTLRPLVNSLALQIGLAIPSAFLLDGFVKSKLEVLTPRGQDFSLFPPPLVLISGHPSCLQFNLVSPVRRNARCAILCE